MCRLGPSLPLSAGWGPVCSPPGGLGLSSHQCWLVPIDLVMPTQADQHGVVQLLPHSCGLPIAQSTSARHATAEAHGSRQVFPRNTCLKHKQKSMQGGLIADSSPARASLAGRNKAGIRGCSCCHSSLLTGRRAMGLQRITALQPFRRESC